FRANVVLFRKDEHLFFQNAILFIENEACSLPTQFCLSQTKFRQRKTKSFLSTRSFVRGGRGFLLLEQNSVSRQQGLFGTNEMSFVPKRGFFNARHHLKEVQMAPKHIRVLLPT